MTTPNETPETCTHCLFNFCWYCETEFVCPNNDPEECYNCSNRFDCLVDHEDEKHELYAEWVYGDCGECAEAKKEWDDENRSELEQLEYNLALNNEAPLEHLEALYEQANNWILVEAISNNPVADSKLLDSIAHCLGSGRLDDPTGEYRDYTLENLMNHANTSEETKAMLREDFAEELG